MLRSLNSGVTGLLNHQTRLDVIGNNISNINTVGYKGRRVTFEESYNQLVSGATRTEGQSGGTNPMQIGLGSAVGSIDVLTGQGSLSNTGRMFDIAIEGNAFFGVSDGEGTFYTRNGAFQLDSQGFIVLPTNGMVLQGKMADSYGNFPPGTAIGDLQIPMSQQSPAKATTSVNLGRNLDSEADAKGSITYSQKMLHPVDYERAPGTNTANDPGRTATTLSSLHNSNGQSLNIKDGDILTISWYDQSSISANDTPAYEQGFRVGGDANSGEISTIDDLIVAINAALAGTGGTASLNPTSGQVEITGITGDVYNLQITSSNPLSNSYVNKAFNFGSYLGNGIGNYNANGGTDPDEVATSGALLRPAEQFDFMERLKDANGNAFVPGFEDGDTIDVFGSVGQTSIEGDKSNPLVFQTGVTLLDDLITKIRNDFSLPAEYIDKDGVHTPSVTMNPTGTDDGIPAGSIVIRGAKGTDFSINNLSIRATNQNSNQTAPTYFNSSMGFTESRKAQDVGVVDTVITVYDESGAEHVLTITFVHTGNAGEWEWSASFGGSEEILQGSGTGKVYFGQDGTVSSWIFDDGGSQLIVDPRNGSSMMRINLNAGGPGDFTGITQFASASTVSVTGQDGYSTGSLTEISIDEFGVIQGAFSNGTARTIAQMMLVDFANPGGLLDLSSSVYTTSANSGDPIWGLPVTQSSSNVKPGALELSNVDLAGEFTDMITTQRGYQANSRIITVSDTMLEELVNLKR